MKQVDGPDFCRLKKMMLQHILYGTYGKDSQGKCNYPDVKEWNQDEIYLRPESSKQEVFSCAGQNVARTSRWNNFCQCIHWKNFKVDPGWSFKLLKYIVNDVAVVPWIPVCRAVELNFQQISTVLKRSQQHGQFERLRLILIFVTCLWLSLHGLVVFRLFCISSF